MRKNKRHGVALVVTLSLVLTIVACNLPSSASLTNIPTASSSVNLSDHNLSSDAVPPYDMPFQPDELIIGLKENLIVDSVLANLSSGDLGEASLNKLAAEHGVQAIHQIFEDSSTTDPLDMSYGLPGVLLLTFKPGANLWAASEAFRSNPSVAYVEFNWILTVSDQSTTPLNATQWTPNDPRFKDQWSLKQSQDHDIDAPEAWNITRGKASIMIAVIDTGVNYKHPDLDGGRVRTDIDKDTINKDNDAMDDHGHGTHVAGIIGADTNNRTGIAGICPGCTILPVKVLAANGSGTAESVSAGIQYAASKGARVLNMSLGMHPNCGCSKTIAKAINYAFEKGALIIAASGNDGKGQISYPASSPRVMAIGATDSKDKRASWSNYGSGLDLVAPGVDILSTWLSGYAAKSGTSMAAPHATGVAGLVLSRNPNLSSRQVWWILRQTADDLGQSGRDNATGFGRLNAYQALRKTRANAVQADVDRCNREPEAGCGGCSTEMALGGTATVQQDLGTLYAFRDKVLSQSARGQAWTSLFYKHNPEVLWLLASDPLLRQEAATTIAEFMPPIRALTGELEGKTVVLTQSHIEAAEHLKAALIKRGSPILAADLEREWSLISPEQYVGQDVRSVWFEITKQD